MITGPRILLHIGPPKSGTTSFQKWCNRNRDGLRAQGVLYPLSLGRVNHTRMMVYASDLMKDDAYFTRNGVATEDDHRAFRRQLAESLATEVSAENPDTLLISNEHLYSRVRAESTVQRAKDMLRRVSDDITVVVHVRPQIDMLVSNASQTARLGEVVDSAWFTRKAVGPGNWLYNMSATVAVWEKVFGADRVQVVPFRRSPDMSAHIIDTLNLSQDGLGEPLRVNEALGWRAIATSNALVEHKVDKALGADQFKALLAALPTSERLQVGLDIAKTVQDRFSAENAALIGRRPELESTDLDPDWDKYDATPNVHRLDEAKTLSAEIAAAVEFVRGQQEK